MAVSAMAAVWEPLPHVALMRSGGGSSCACWCPGIDNTGELVRRPQVAEEASALSSRAHQPLILQDACLRAAWEPLFTLANAIAQKLLPLTVANLSAACLPSESAHEELCRTLDHLGCRKPAGGQWQQETTRGSCAVGKFWGSCMLRTGLHTPAGP